MADQKISRRNRRKRRDDDHPLWEIVNEALPNRELAIRDELIYAVIGQSEHWKSINAKNERRAEMVRELVAEGKKLWDHIDKVIAALQPHLSGAEEIIAAISLDRVLSPARDALRTWDRMHRPRKHRHRDFRLSLAADLRQLCCEFIGCSAKEFADFLQKLNDSAAWKAAGLPTLSTAGLDKAKQLAKKKRRTN